jgi:hypothetical protein
MHYKITSILLNSKKGMQWRKYFIFEEANGSTSISTSSKYMYIYIIYSSCLHREKKDEEKCKQGAVICWEVEEGWDPTETAARSSVNDAVI